MEEQKQKSVAEADVIWLAGGDTPTQFRYLKKYGLDTVLKQHDGLACVDISVEPHFIRSEVSDELLDLSEKYTIYGLCDDSFIVCSGNTIEFYGEIYKLSNGDIEKTESVAPGGK